MMGRVIAHVPGDEPSSTPFPPSGSAVKTREEALKLIQQKKRIEEEMDVYMGVLTTVREIRINLVTV